jgi:hypothetical protein
MREKMGFFIGHISRNQTREYKIKAFISTTFNSLKDV